MSVVRKLLPGHAPRKYVAVVVYNSPLHPVNDELADPPAE